MRHTGRKVLLGFAVLSICCSCVIAQELSGDADRDRRSIDVGWLLRNLLLNSATASDVKANATRNIANVPLQPAPATTRRPRTTRPPSSAAPPAPPVLNPLINLFAGSSQFWKVPPPATTTTTTTTTEEPATLPELLPPAPQPRPIYSGVDYDYYYPSGYDGFVGHGVQHGDPSEYDYADGPISRAPARTLPQLPPRPATPRKGIRNRQRIAPAPPAPPQRQLPIPQTPPARRRPTSPTTAPRPAPAPAAAPQPQRARLLYEYLQRDDTSFNDDADEQPAPAPPSAAESEADTQQQDDDNGDDVAASDGGDNEIANYENGPTSFDSNSPRALPYARQPYAKSSPKSPFGAQSYYNSEPLTPHRFNSYSSAAATGNSGFGDPSASVHHASPARGSYKFRDAFSDFETTYDGGHLPAGGHESYKFQYHI